ncbi:MAG: class I SAM-dependent methyltransferase [Nitrospira sp.]|nr:class I SAM-dependent methyltransferase [Nitrospira sp.]
MTSFQEPAKLLIDYLPLLPCGKALDVAMGKGRNGIFLASHGFEVTGLERDEESIRMCRNEADRAGVKIDARCVDLEDLESYKIESSVYDVIICFYYLQRNLFSRIKEALKPQGIIIYETFLIDQHIKTGHPKRREYCFEHNELLKLFIDFRIIYYREGQDSKGTYKASLVAQKI